jgi:hypothetical protein
MSDRDGERSENETILMALDQISQTIDVMTSVVGRLRSYVQEREDAGAERRGEAAPRGDTTPDRILH